MPGLAFPFAAGDDADPDYLLFLRHIRPDGNSYALELPADGATPPVLLKYEPPTANSHGEAEHTIQPSSPGNASLHRRGSKQWQEAKDSAEPLADASIDDEDSDVEEEYRFFLDHARVVNGRVALEIGSLLIHYEVDDEEVEEVEEEPAVVVLGKDNVGEEKVGGSIGSETIDLDSNVWDWRADPVLGQEKVEEEYEKLLDVAAVGKPDALKSETSSSDADDDKCIYETPVVMGSEGSIWPTHILQRPDSDFKRRLVCVLRKPFVQKEYDELLDMATVRTPLMKLRQVRSDAKFYSTGAMGSSYFDHYPDLATQIESANYYNGLALLRGLFFWLQNNAHEDQFMPWRSDSKDYDIVPLNDSDFKF